MTTMDLLDLGNEARSAHALSLIRQPVKKSSTENLAIPQTKERAAVVSSLPITMHTGQIIMLTKMLTASDLRFYEFEEDVPTQRWLK